MIRQLRWMVLALFIGAMVGPNLLTALADGDTPQTITFTSTAPTHGDIGDTYSPTATASSDLTVALTIDSSSTSVCSISDSTVTLSAIGTCTIDANQAGNDTYEAATQAQQSFDVYPTYSSAVLATDPSAYWPLSDTGGDTAADASGHDHPGTLADGVTEGGPSMPDSSEPSMAFDGSGGISTTLVQPSVTAATDGAWINTSSGSGPIISGRDDVDTVDGNLTLDVGMFNSGSGLAEFGLNTAYAAYMKQSTVEVDTGDWVFVVGTFSSTSGDGISTSDMNLYINGSLATGSNAYSGGGASSPLTGTGDLYVGEEAWAPSYFDGDMADAFVLYGTALSASQITALYEGELTQSIAFTSAAPTDASVDSTYTPAATSTSGLPVTLMIDSASSSVCSMSSDVVTFNSAGICLVDANQAGNAGYTAAPQVQQAIADYTDAETVLALSPSAYWPLSDIDTATAVDFGGTDNTGDLQGGVYEDSTPGIPDIDSVPVMSFDGSGSYLSTTNNLTIPETVTEAVWFKTSSANDGLFSFITTQTGTPGSDWDEQMYVGSNGDLEFGIGTMISTSSAVDDGEWHLAVGTLTPTSMSLYFDGSLVGTTTSAGSPPSYAGYWRVGEVDGASWTNTDGSMDPFTGDLADAAIFPTALTATQVGAIYAGLEWQSISLTSTAPPNAAIGTTYTPTGTATSGLTVSFTVDSSSSSVCAISEGVVTFDATGTCLIDANQAGNSTYFTARQVRQSVLVGGIFGLDPTAFWPLADTGGSTAEDLSGDGDIGSLAGGVTEDIAPESGGPNTTPVMSFDGSSGYITTTNAYDDPTTYTIAGWFKTTSTNGGLIIQFAQDQSGTGGDYDRQLYVGTDGNLYFGEYCGGTATLSTTTPVDTGQWDYAVGVSNGTSMELYLNGNLVASSTYSECQNFTGYWRIGGGGLYGWPNEGSTWFDGDLADIAVFPTALTIGQIRALYAVRDAVLQTVSFTSSAPTDMAVDDTYTPTATATSDLTVTITIDPSSSSVCSIASGVVTFNALGTCVIDANQPGNATYYQAPESQQLVTDVAYAEDVLGLDPSAFWPLSDTSGSKAMDLVSGEGDSGTLVGGVSQDVTPGIPESTSVPAMSFDGSSGYITTPYAEPDTTAFSMSAWFKTSSSNQVMIVASARDDAFDYSFALSVGGTWNDRSAGQVAFFLDGNSFVDGIQSDASYDDGDWHVVTGVWSAPSSTEFNPSQMKLYIDGTLVATSALGSGGEFTSPAPGGGQLALGSNLSGWNDFDGDLADVATFDSALTQGQVDTLASPLGEAQSISFTSSAPGGAVEGGNSYTPTATATSGLDVSFSSATSSVCPMTDGVVIFVGTGTCTIQADQAGDASWLAAPEVDQSFSVSFPSCTPSVTGISPFQAEETQTVTITGSCLGSFNTFSGDNGYFVLNDLSGVPWHACYWADSVDCDVTMWTNTSITFSGYEGDYGGGYTVSPGDLMSLNLSNPQDGNAAITKYFSAVGQPEPTAEAEVLAAAAVGDDGDSAPDPRLCKCGDPVNMESGDLYETATDISIPGRGFNLDVTRRYNSLSASTDGPFGYGWTSNLGMSLTESDDSTVVTIVDSTGTPVTFTLEGDTWTAPEFNVSTLSYADDVWTYSQWNGDVYQFNSYGQLTSESDRNGNTTTFTYSSGLLSSMTDASGRSLSFTWSADNIAEIEEPDDQTVHYGYTDGNLTSVEDQAGGYAYYTYDDSHDLLTIEDPDGNTTTNTYNDSGQVLTQTDPMSHDTTYSYSIPVTNESATLMTDPDGNETYFLYDWGLLIQKTAAYGTEDAEVTTYTYDPNTLGMTTETDPDGNTTTYTYDANGNMLTQTTPIGHITTYTYNDLNEPLTITAPNGVTTTNTYDADGNLLTTSKPLLNDEDETVATQTTTYSYGDDDNPGLPTSVEDPDGDTTTYTYDSYGDLASSTNAAGDETTYTYDALGEKLTMVSPDGNVVDGDPGDFTTSYTYDALGDVLTTTDPNGDETVDTYDADGNPLATTQPAGSETLTTYNADSESTEVQYKNSGGTVLRTTHTGYDAGGNVTSITDGNDNETTYTYNALNQKVSSTNALSKTTSYAYDGDGNLLGETEPNGAEISNTYDADDELIATSYSDSTPSVSYSYDSVGQKTSMTDGTATSTWTYNSLGEETSYTNGSGAEVEYGYDLAGNETSITYPGDLTVDQAFNDANEIISITDWNDKESTFSYDANDNLTAEDLANGVTNSYTYDAANNLASISDTKGEASIFSATYTRNSDNLVMQDTSQPSNGDYAYTGLNEVCYAASSNSDACSSPREGATAYSYDAAGNLIEDNGVQQEFNDGDELCWTVTGTSDDGCGTLPSGGTAYTYDDNGNLTGITPSSGSATALGFDAAGQLSSYQLGDGATTTYAYDGDGLRQSKTTSDTTTEFAWNDSGALPLLLREEAGDESTYYVYGPTGLPLEEVLPDSDTFYYSRDNLGSTRVLTDASGDVADTDIYDPYGNVTASTGDVQNHLLFCGQFMDIESGLYYLQARYYDPASAQFLSFDPLAEETRLPYAYTAGDPINEADTTGLCSWLGCVSAAVGAVTHTVSAAVGAISNVVDNACLRGPIGAGWNSNTNGGCSTVLTGSQGAQLIGATIVTAVGTVGTLGLADLLFGAAASESASGTLIGSLSAFHLYLTAPFILGSPFGIGLAGLLWGYYAATSGNSGCKQ